MRREKQTNKQIKIKMREVLQSNGDSGGQIIMLHGATGLFCKMRSLIWAVQFYCTCSPFIIGV